MNIYSTVCVEFEYVCLNTPRLKKTHGIFVSNEYIGIHVLRWIFVCMIHFKYVEV